MKTTLPVAALFVASLWLTAPHAGAGIVAGESWQLTEAIAQWAESGFDHCDEAEASTCMARDDFVAMIGLIAGVHDTLVTAEALCTPEDWTLEEIVAFLHEAYTEKGAPDPDIPAARSIAETLLGEYVCE